MNFKQALALLEARGHGNKKNNLVEVKKTAALLGLKSLPYKTVHVSGTNGKGTVCFLLAKNLKLNGLKTGLFTSPHITDICERVQINGKKISKKDFALYLSKVLKKETVKLKFFEILTLLALLYFKDKKVDFAVMECGISARKDSTNIIKPCLSIITSVSLEHTQILGKTLKQIAYEKAGVIKSKIPCITGVLPTVALKEIKTIAIKNKAPFFTVKKEETKLKENQNIVLKAAEILGLKKVNLKLNLPCRFEVIKRGGKFVIKDGAHNPAAIKELARIYKNSPYFKKENTLIFACSADKDYKTMAKILNPLFKNIILTEASKNAVPTQKLKKYFPSAQIYANPKAVNLKKLSGNILICGSFYLVFCLFGKNNVKWL